MRIARTVTIAAAGLALITTLAACGGGAQGSAQAAANSIQEAISAGQPAGGADETAATSEGSAETDTTESDASTSASSAPLTRTIGKTGWYDGFAITVDDITAEQSYQGAVDVTVNLSYQNLGAEGYPPPNGDVQINGESQEAFFDAPEIPAGGKAKGTMDMTVLPAKRGDTITPDQAIDQLVIVYGDTGDNQTTIPLAAAGKVDSVEPKDLAVTGTLAQGQITVDVVNGTLAPSYVSGEKGKTLLNLRVKLTCAPGCQAQGYNTGVDEFSIIGPDGSSVVADDRSEYCCDALYPATVSDSERNIVTFVVPSPGTGAYTLTYNNDYLTSTGTAPGTLAFTA